MPLSLGILLKLWSKHPTHIPHVPEVSCWTFYTPSSVSQRAQREACSCYGHCGPWREVNFSVWKLPLLQLLNGAGLSVNIACGKWMQNWQLCEALGSLFSHCFIFINCHKCDFNLLNKHCTIKVFFFPKKSVSFFHLLENMELNLEGRSRSRHNPIHCIYVWIQE